MDFLITSEELNALCGLPHIQQLTYLRGIRPYMDVKTGLVGIKRRISYQSISEQLYVEPHQGFKSQSYSRDQVRRAVAGLVRAGILVVQSEGMQLILKCDLATRHYSVQNKAAINPPQQAATNPPGENLMDTEFSEVGSCKADIAQTQKAAIPLIKDNIYIYLLAQFEKFWQAYPEKKSKQNAWLAFQGLNPNDKLLNTIFQALNAEINHRLQKQQAGLWVPPWKYPANWLAQRCFEDELTMDQPQENNRATRKQHSGNEDAKDPFWNPSAFDDAEPENNVIQLHRS